MRALIAVAAVLAWTVPAAADVALTVYNQGLGLVTETRPFELERGLQAVRMTDVAARIERTSVRLQFPGAPVEIYEQNFHYDLVNTQAILDRYLDKTIRLVTKEGKVYEGTLLSTGAMYVLQMEEGLELVNPEEVLQIDLARLPEGFFTRPTLEWLLGSPRGGTVEAEISYLTTGVSWNAAYVAHLNADDTRIDLSGWASIDNQSGATYRDARLKLIAGDIHRAAERRPEFDRGAGMTLEAMAMPKAGFEERAFFEYHLYDLPRRTTVAHKETKQIALFEPATAAVQKKYLYRPYRDAQKVAVVVEFENSKANGLGIPLPRGLVRLTKSDIDGSEQLLGEDRIDHTPKDEEITLEVGNAFDLATEYQVTDRRQISRRVTETDHLIKLRNHKTEVVTIQVEQQASRWADWEILRSSHPWEKVDADTFRFILTVEPDRELELTYTLRTGR